MSQINSVELILHGIHEPGGCFKQKPFRRYLNEELIPKIIMNIPVLIKLCFKFHLKFKI